jgi:hypothetical protein
VKRRTAQGVIFAILFLMTLGIPLLIEAIFPPGDGANRPLPPEEAISTEAAPSTDADETARRRDNVAWVLGDEGSVLDANASETEEAAKDAVEAEGGEAAEPTLDLRPGVFAGYSQSWDNFDIHREMFTGGAFFFPTNRLRLQASESRLRFRDDTDKIYGNAWRLDGAERLPGEWLLEEGLERDTYDNLRKSWNGDARLSGALTPKLGVTVEGGRHDMWERLANITDALSLWQAGLGLFYQLLPRWWLAGFANGGWFSDHNNRASFGGEAGYVISPRWGLSAAAGAEETTFADGKATYWSPMYYHYIFGRLRLERNFERAPFEPLPGSPMTAAERWGYLAEFTGGVNDEGHYEQSMRAGLRLRATRSISGSVMIYHLDSDGRFDETYAENRVDGGIEVRFGSGK